MGGRLRRRSGDRPGPAAGRARHRVPAARVAGAARHPGRQHSQLQRDRPAHRFAQIRACRGRGLRGEHAGGGHPVSSRGAQRRRPVRLPLGRATQARPAGPRGKGMNAQLQVTADAGGRLRVYDWGRVAEDLDVHGYAMLEALLSPRECTALASQYEDDGRFRRRVVMGRHGFGRGEYRYFSYPLPELVAELRTAAYSQLVPIANRWNASMDMAVRYPATHAEFIER